MDAQQREKIAEGVGIFAALDQSGGSTLQALELYGIDRSQYSSEEEMFDLVHELRKRVISSPRFTGHHILGAILFTGTMDREIEGLGSAEYLWQRKHIVPFLKVDQGLADAQQGVRMMKPIPDLDALLARALAAGVFGTKARSLVQRADERGIAAVLDQQFDYARRILDAGLVPILEPEVEITSPQKQAAEELLRTGITDRLRALPEEAHVMLKLSLPSEPGFYQDLITHPRVLRVVALSGGYNRDKADRLLAQNPGLLASFSRALLEGLSVHQTQTEFDTALGSAIADILAASSTQRSRRRAG
ncbi:fructose bisphosphate aldolase [Modestobacter muralis]|uniref:fructose-bisphosphate aldolase n=1 Tax=Modestobacter muralis TaxID=1608614 RepID=A0A6P0H4E4_9ACTN|nr:fructose bisphosphate aldolase [Modestobacter muralis]NEK93358.1 fructose bisphosphate aldolase [Modestobacter muralis]NEN50125.1 fructose bisphosphate aldolase [Modestobacter muralis]